MQPIVFKSADHLFGILEPRHKSRTGVLRSWRRLPALLFKHDGQPARGSAPLQFAPQRSRSAIPPRDFMEPTTGASIACSSFWSPATRAYQTFVGPGEGILCSCGIINSNQNSLLLKARIFQEKRRKSNSPSTLLFYKSAFASYGSSRWRGDQQARNPCGESFN